jgi:hypothetical protein
MSKKNYQMPSRKVVALRHQTAILQSSPSGVNASRRGYESTEAQNWNESE